MTSGSLRRASGADVEALLRLRRAMYAAWGRDDSDPEWQQRFRVDVPERLAAGSLVAYLVEDGGEAVSGGLGWVEQHLPGPGNPNGRRGYIASMSTLPHARRRGHARRVLAALLDWFAGQGLTLVELKATADGKPLYAEAGFEIPGGLPMVWRAPGTEPRAVTDR